MGRREKRRKAMARCLVDALKKEGKLGELLESEPPTRAGAAIQRLIADVANDIAGEERKPCQSES